MTQIITPQLRQWIIAQTHDGFGADAVIKSMLASGWHEDVAALALKTTLAQPLGLQQPTAAEETPPCIMKVPRPPLATAPLYIDLPDRRVHVLSVMSKPPIVVFGNVLSDEECDVLIAGARPRMARSLTVATKTGGDELNGDRTSRGMFYRRGENETVRAIEERLAGLIDWPLENGEGLQILHYRAGTEYKPHYDYFDPNEPGTATILKRGGQRVATIIMYLHEPACGGATTFPDVQLEVAPKRGNAVFFSYDRAHPVSQSLHGGAPVISGEKWIATKWLRERRFE